MSRYIRIVIFSTVLILSGCAIKDGANQNVIGKKSFEAEDYMILSALENQKEGNAKTAIEIYKALYEKSGKVNYLIEAVKLSFIVNNSVQTKELLDMALQKAPKNKELRRILIGHFIRSENYAAAQKEILSLLEEDKSVRNLKIAGTINFQMKSYDLALKYFESAYNKEIDEGVLLNIVDIMYNYLNRKDDAIAFLETHIRMQRCEVNSCFKLIEIYGKEKNVDGIISTYKRLYDRFGHDEYAKKVVELLIYKKDKQGAIEFLDTSGYNQEMLLDIYVSSSDFTGALKVAKRLYKETSKVDYLGKMAIYEYEANKDKIDKKILESVSQKFEQVIYKVHNPLYLNYYGYLLIDYDMDIDKGIELVKSALLKEPNSPFYLDSLAWGYYKLGKCQEAKEIMDELIKNTDEQEVLMHYEEIKKCLKKK